MRSEQLVKLWVGALCGGVTRRLGCHLDRFKSMATVPEEYQQLGHLQQDIRLQLDLEPAPCFGIEFCANDVNDE
jgi:hypothetical protein